MKISDWRHNSECQSSGPLASHASHRWSSRWLCLSSGICQLQVESKANSGEGHCKASVHPSVSPSVFALRFLMFFSQFFLSFQSSSCSPCPKSRSSSSHFRTPVTHSALCNFAPKQFFFLPATQWIMSVWMFFFFFFIFIIVALVLAVILAVFVNFVWLWLEIFDFILNEMLCLFWIVCWIFMTVKLWCCRDIILGSGPPSLLLEQKRKTDDGVLSAADCKEN